MPQALTMQNFISKKRLLTALVAACVTFIIVLATYTTEVTVRYTSTKQGTLAAIVGFTVQSSANIQQTSTPETLKVYAGQYGDGDSLFHLQFQVPDSTIEVYSVTTKSFFASPVEVDLRTICPETYFSGNQLPVRATMQIPPNEWGLMTLPPLQTNTLYLAVYSTAVFLGVFAVLSAIGTLISPPSPPLFGSIAIGMTAFLVFAATMYVGWPGFMSSDSFVSLYDARNSVRHGTYPAMISYIWRLFDWIYPGQLLMWAVQNALFMGAIAWIAQSSRWNKPISCLLVALMLAPPIFGCLVVVWKDVITAAFLLLVVASVLHIENKQGSKAGVVLLFVSSIMASTCRLNAFPLILPFLFFFYYKGHYNGGKRLWKKHLAFLVSTCLIFTISMAINTLKIPSFERGKSGIYGFLVFMRHDSLGMTYFSEDYTPLAQLLKEGMVPTKEIMEKAYNPQHVHFSVVSYNRQKVRDPDTVMSVWKELIVKHPTAWIKHKLLLAAELLGLRAHGVYCHTFITINPGKVDMDLTDVQLPELRSGPQIIIANALFNSSKSLFIRPFTYLFVFGLLAWWTARQYKPDSLWICCLVSGIFCFGVNLAIAPGAENRYMLWSILSFICAFIVAKNNRSYPSKPVV